MADRDSSGRKETDLIDEISTSVHQLDAMLMVIVGSDTFTTMSTALQTNYLWACHDKIRAVRDAWTALIDERLRQRKAKGGAE